ncbi:uncharacterized protein IL334_005408 [Kwoniella shivajii]|uniref:Uncharacterized protein n=1 Tax=Kwoniella shivajii TaxID=564305 RepID=A0ABZ1D4D0_9TREE|nr:hypothetical protein IL334_005408 [Kwoniella shivajii]
MPAPISELMPKQQSRLRSVLDNPDPIEATDFFKEVEQMRNKAADWTSISDKTFRQYISFSDDFDGFYDLVWRKQFPDAPIDPWTMDDSQAMADIICGFLLFRLRNTLGRHKSGQVRSTTLEAWSKNMLYLAAYNLIGRGTLATARDYSVMTGKLPDKSDSLWSLVRNWCSAASAALCLPHASPEYEFFGLPEAVLIIRRIEQIVVQTPRRVHSLIQTKAAVQLLLTLGIRPSSLGRPSATTSVNAKMYLEENNVSFIQIAPGVYETKVNFRWLKGFSQQKHGIANFAPVLPPVSKVQNLQLEFASTIIPILIHRQKLCCQTEDGEHIFSDIDEFLSSDSRHFYVTEKSEDSIFRQVTTSGELSATPSSAGDIQRRLKEVAVEIRLPNCKAYHFRRNVGDIARIISGREGQASALNHFGRDHDVGRTVYSHGVEDSILPRVVLEEFKDSDGEAIKKLEASRHHLRSLDGRAVQAMLRLWREGMLQVGDIIDPPEEDEIQEELYREPEYSEMAKAIEILEEAGEDQNNSEDYIQLQKRNRYLRRRARKRVVKRKEGAVVRSEGSGSRAVHGTQLEYKSAKTALDHLRSSIPYVLSHPIGSDPSGDFDRFWETALRITPQAPGDEAPYMIHLEDEGLCLETEGHVDYDPDDLEMPEEQITRIVESVNFRKKKESAPEIVLRVQAENAAGNGTRKRKHTEETIAGSLGSSSRKKSAVHRANAPSAKQQLGLSGNLKENEVDEDGNRIDGNDPVVQNKLLGQEADNFLSDLEIFDDSSEAKEPSDIHIVRYRAEYMRRNFRLLQLRDLNEVEDPLANFVTTNGWCPFCVPGELGMIRFIRNKAGRISHNGVGTGILHSGDTGKLERMKLIHQHLPRMHPEIWLNMSELGLQSVKSDGSIKDHDPADFDQMAQLLADAYTLELPEEPMVEDSQLTEVLWMRNQWMDRWAK